MNIPFWKMHGAGNDFILIDDRALTFPVSDNDWLAGIAARRTGIGCDGIILIQPSDKADFRMRFFNPDGSEVEMCGNGGRCVAMLACEIGAAPEKMRIETPAGILGAGMEGDKVRLEMTGPKDRQLNRSLKVNGNSVTYSFVNTGVPHVVVETDNLDECDVHALGSGIRYHKTFAPDGANADFISITGPQSLSIRTYERGVEGETPACGTGIVAGALVAACLDRVKPPVDVTTAGGDVLAVDFRLTEDGAERVTLLGPAVHVFKGNLEYQ